MSVTTVTSVTEGLDDVEYEAALERLRAYRAQLDQADQQADAGSLDRAADLAWIYEHAKERWIAEIGEPKITHHRGRPVVRDSRSRFAKWVKEKLDLRPTYSYYLLNAHELAGIVFTRVKENRPETAGPLRPLYKLLKEQRGEDAIAIWRRAIELADGQPPTAGHVRQALRDHDKATGRTATDRTQGYYQRTVKEARAKILREFDWILNHGNEDDVKAVLLEIQQRLANLQQSSAE